jgi:ubiquinone/menaquinone biosynthesis C-methylase UbiE
MDNILRTLSPAQVAVDLGCGGGSFNYGNYPCRIVGIDISLNRNSLFRDGNRVCYVQSEAMELPLANNSVDAFVCNHTFEHFPEYRRALAEIDRVLKPTGMLWIAIPDGSSLDDAIYRYIFEGGGHINRFSRQQMVDEVERHTSLKVIQTNMLMTGFIYLKKPTVEQLVYFPDRAQKLRHMPPRLNKGVIVLLNALFRIADKVLNSRLSQYGWGFVFARQPALLDSLPSYFNVCWNCGSGQDAQYLKTSGNLRGILGIKVFSCPCCQARGFFFDPPAGFS